MTSDLFTIVSHPVLSCRPTHDFLYIYKPLLHELRQLTCKFDYFVNMCVSQTELLLSYFMCTSQFPTVFSSVCRLCRFLSPTLFSKKKSMSSGWNGWTCGRVKPAFQYWLNYQLGAPSEAQRHEIAWDFFSLCPLPLDISSATFHSKDEGWSL